jgi:hypothetical protein
MGHCLPAIDAWGLNQPSLVSPKDDPEPRTAGFTRASWRRQAKPSISLVSWVIRLGWTLAGSPGIFGVPNPVNTMQQGGLSGS